ncbi:MULTISPECIES: adenine-specific methyltransferase EcoRI family protein [unclassified Variovorax]|uniref:adenine-specific methyltransferase EcoRI family protein n=1 Tax=unclassified Variovorax TaxID=663243 RepID=UPI0013191141|nr:MULTISPECIES: adenine-specific methyltransferase EcoRI family protein [unclassified Variovorax]VTU41828.1 hypothetical protein H6P1_00054 [Variovorax sp. PBL-H6]VTU44502.1 hypothetical protein SRS16P1_00848 [Variovorax sp. SRS16]VTU44548.1 hypothetical protein E5P1_00841 [Variovorax sp. PBL-E5]
MTRAATSPTNSSTSNTSLHAAKRGKNDEFYTQLTDIEKELRHYKGHFAGKTVFCNCDDPEWSNFWKYFTLNFEHLGLAKLVATHYASGGPSYKLEFTGADKSLVKTDLTGDGDFRSAECVEILQEADIVVTNPPFSLFREYVAQLIEHKKQFLIIGNQNALTYKEIFTLIKENVVWAGTDNGGTKWFEVPTHYEIQTQSRVQIIDGVKYFSMGSVYWFTNLFHSKRKAELVLFKVYAGSESSYPRYDNFDAIEVSKVSDIPCDYAGCMGVPITFLDKYNPSQFEIVGSFNAGAHGEELGATKTAIVTKGKSMLWNGPVVNKAPLYKRIIVKLKKQNEN